jgi:hypothetical protein
MEVLSPILAMLPDSSLGLLGAFAVYLIITAKRNSTKLQRDEQISLFEYRLSQMEQQTKTLSDKLEKVVEILNVIKVEMAKMNKDK